MLGGIRAAGGDRWLEQQALGQLDKEHGGQDNKGLQALFGEKTHSEAAKQELDVSGEIRQKIELDFKQSAQDIAKTLTPEMRKEVEDLVKKGQWAVLQEISIKFAQAWASHR
jgi:hypothetical protein